MEITSLLSVLVYFTLLDPGSLPSSKQVQTSDVVRAVGVGKAPPRVSPVQGRLMARRAAEVNAMRNLSKKLGFRSPSVVRGFRYVSTTYLPDRSVEVVVEFRIPQRSTP